MKTGIVSTLLLVTACSGTGTPAQVSRGSAPEHWSSSSAPSVVAYSSCMRLQGVPKFPDPDSNGQLPKIDAERLGVSDSQLMATRHACQHLLPDTGGAISAESVDQCYTDGNCPGILVQHLLSEERNFAQCMRSHGVPNWPDPSADSQGRPVFAISISKLGFNPYSSPIWAQGNKCAHLMPELTGAPFQVSP